MEGGRPRRGTEAIALLATVSIIVLALVLLMSSDVASAQTEPPALGDGNWVVRDETIIRDRGAILLRGDLTVTDGGSLTLSNTTLLFVMAEPGEHGLRVSNGATLRIVEGATVGSSRPNIAWTCVIDAGCTLRVVDSTIEECGMSAFGVRPDWRRLAMYIATSDARVENTSFLGGLAGLYFAPDVVAFPVRNCTFLNAYGIVSHGTGVEDCTFRDQTLYGVVFHGGTEGYISRCRFESVFATCLQVGYEFFEPYQLFTATARIEDCTFLTSTRAIRVLTQSEATIERCEVAVMEREAIAIHTLARVRMRDGNITGTNVAVLAEDGSHLEWEVLGGATVRGGNLTLTGNVTVASGASLQLLEFRNLTMLNRASSPADIRVDGRLVMVNGSLQIPPPTSTPESWLPVRLSGGDLHLEGVRRLDMEPGMVLRSLTALRCKLQVGQWSIADLRLEECSIGTYPGLSEPWLELAVDGGRADGLWVACSFTDGMAGTPQVRLGPGEYQSYDTLWDLEGLVGAGRLVWSTSSQEDAWIQVHWSARSDVHWQNQLPIAGADVVITDVTGTNYVDTTGPTGRTSPRYVLTEKGLGDGSTLEYTPLEFTVDLAGLEGYRLLEVVDSPMTVDITVVDLRPPTLVVDQGGFVGTNSSYLNLTGMASDEHSGVAFLEAALLPFAYHRVDVDPVTGAFRTGFQLRLGHQTISLRLYDSVGNRRIVMVDVYFNLFDPFISIEEPSEGEWTNHPLVLLTGTTEPGSWVEAAGRRTQAENGTFHLPVELVEGTNQITVHVTSLVGNHNQTTIVVHLDTQAPLLELRSPSSSPFSTSQRTETISGTSEPGATVFVNSAQLELDEEGRFSARVNLDEDANLFTVTSIDRAGNVNSREVVFYLDSTPPHLSVLVDGVDASRFTKGGVLRTAALRAVLAITTEPGAILSVDGITVEADDQGQAVVEHNLSEGHQTIMVRAVDAAGNEALLGPIEVEVDRTPPSLTITDPPPSMTHEVLFILRGRTEPNVTVTVNGAHVSVDSDGRFIRNFLLSYGTNRMMVVASDRYGQTTEETVEVFMKPRDLPPDEGEPSPAIYLLLAMMLLLALEAVLLHLWWSWREARSDGRTKEV